jgi:two-component sensor histidine kinase
MILPAGFASIVLWGRDLLQIYNDDYRELMGAKHPSGFGKPNRECWPEVWHINKPVYDRVFCGETVTFEDALYPLARTGVSEDVWLTITYSPLRDDLGEIGGVLVSMYETTARVIAERDRHQAAERLMESEAKLRESSDRMELLVAELQHRTRNMLTVVQALFEQSAAAGNCVETLRERFCSRLGALSRVNGLLSHLDAVQRISFDELVREEIVAIAGPERDGQISLDGPKGVKLRSSSIQTFALALHELATNAVKHGALSRPDGMLIVTWSTTSRDGTGRWLHVEWRETGITVLAQPEADVTRQRSGAGRRLIERALPYQLGAEVDYKLGASGLVCIISLPTSQGH